MIETRSCLIGCLLISLSGVVWAEKSASQEFLEKHWRNAAVFYNSGLYVDAAQEFQAVQTILPNDILTQEYIRKCSEVGNLGTRVGGEVPLKREFNLSGKNVVPVGDLPGFSSGKSEKKTSAPKPVSPPKVAASRPAAAPAPQSLTKHDMEIIYNKGVSLLNAGEYGNALDQFNKILAVNPRHEPSLIRAKKCRAALRRPR